MPDSLTPARRQALKARAHALDPVVLIGAGGLTAAVLAEIDRALAAHELIKIRAAGEDRAQRDALLAEICERAGATPVQHIGKILVVHRERVEPPPEPPAPRPRPRPRPAKKRSAVRTTRSAPAPRGAGRRPARAAPKPTRRGRARPR